MILFTKPPVSEAHNPAGIYLFKLKNEDTRAMC